MTVMLENAVLYNKFYNETETSIWLRLNDLNGTDFQNFVFPRVKYNAGDIDPPQQGPVIITVPFEAIYDATSGTSMSVQRSNS